jgi:hypothetical protein
MYLGTFFFRNRPALELMRRLVNAKLDDSTLRIAVLGCSIGAEAYSILWTVRSARLDLKVLLEADNSVQTLLSANPLTRIAMVSAASRLAVLSQGGARGLSKLVRDNALALRQL